LTVVVVMGVAGCGKSTVGALLADRLGWQFVDGDWLHPAANVEKMRSGVALTDDDRWPWLEAISGRIAQICTEGESVVVACSALKRAYRDVLIGARPGARLVYLKGDAETIARRLAARDGHFMPPSLLASQYEVLEEPAADENAIVLGIDRPPRQMAESLARLLRDAGPSQAAT
jgi:gluconokinase